MLSMWQCGFQTEVTGAWSPKVDLTSSAGWLSSRFLNAGKVEYDSDGVVESARATTSAYICDMRFRKHTGHATRFTPAHIASKRPKKVAI